MIVITGFGRTGTSFLAKFLQEMGLITYEHGYSEEVNAGIEPLDVTAINNGLLEGTLDLQQAKPLIENIHYPIIKDPRFLYGDILTQWLSVRKDLKFLVLLRNPTEIYLSRKEFLKKVEGSERWVLTPIQLSEAFEKFIETCVKNEVYPRFLHFPQFLDSYSLVWLQLTALGIKVDLEHGKKVWNLLVDKSKVHHEFK